MIGPLINYSSIAHGTGTRIGDAIELQTVERIFTGKRSKPLPLGSVKAVLGHTEECAGLASKLHFDSFSLNQDSLL